MSDKGKTVWTDEHLDAIEREWMIYSDMRPLVLQSLREALAENKRLKAKIARVRARLDWRVPTTGQHTNGPTYIFHVGQARAIEDALWDEGDENAG